MINSPHILLITPYYWPEVAASVPLMTSLAKGLNQRSMKVTVLTSSTRGGCGDDRRMGGEREKGLRVIRTWNPFARRTGFFYKAMEMVWFFGITLFRGLSIRKVDLIFVSSSPPLVGLPAAILGRFKAAPVVYNLQDLFPESGVASGMLRRHGLAYRLFSTFEKWTYAWMAMVIAISESFAAHVKRICPRCRLAVIPNWVDVDQMREIPVEKNGFLPLLPFKDRFIVLYAGNLGYLQNLELLLAAAAILQKKDPEILFVFVGEGNQKTALIERAEKEGLSNCVFLGFQPYEKLVDVYSTCDIGVVPMRPGAGASSVPSKTWNYFACSRPVIACVEKESPFAEIIELSKAGTVVPSNCAADLAEAICEYNRNPELRKKSGAAGRRYVEETISESVALDQYARVLMQIAQEG